MGRSRRSASGKVYKAVLSNGEAVAVKKLSGTPKKENDVMDRSSNNGYEAEVAILGKIRHKNIVKLWCCCNNKDFKLLVYEYMPNGSLGDLLHSSKGGLLEWRTRYKIALDAAEGLSRRQSSTVTSNQTTFCWMGSSGQKCRISGLQRPLERGLNPCL